MIESKVFDRYKMSIEDLKPQILDTIVEVYGERHRHQIEDRLSNLYINTYVTAEDVKHDYSMKNNHFLNMLSVKFLKKIGIEVSKETEDKVYKRGTYNLTNKQKEILNQYFQGSTFSENGKIFSFNDELLNSENEYIKKMHMRNRCVVLKAMGLDISPENYDKVLETEQGQEALKRVKSVYEVAAQCQSEYDKFKEENKDYIEYLKKIEDYNQELKLKYLKKFAQKILPYCEKEEAIRINEALSKNYSSEYIFIGEADKDGIYLASYGMPKILAFSKNAQKKLEDHAYEASQIKSTRIKYFKAKGLDLGDNYEAYENSEEAKKLLPDQERVESIYKIKDECDKEMDMEFFLNTGNYQTCKQNILAQNLKLQESFCKEFVENGVTCIVPNVKQDENGDYQLFNIVHLPLAKILPEYKDEQIVHEILHCVESSMKPISEDKVYIKFGFDECTETICNDRDRIIIDDKHEEADVTRRKYELFSENLHQELAIEVTKRLHEKGIYLYGDPKIAREGGGSSYEHYNMVTLKFQSEYRDEIIDGMMEENREVITDIVDKENFEKLNETVNKYAELPYYKMMDDFISKRDTELTRKSRELQNRGRQIVADMKEYEESRQEYSISVQKIGKATIHRPLQKKRTAEKVLTNDKTNVLEGEQSKDEQ